MNIDEIMQALGLSADQKDIVKTANRVCNTSELILSALKAFNSDFPELGIKLLKTALGQLNMASESIETFIQNNEDDGEE